MKDFLLLMARYNGAANAGMMDCFRQSGNEKLKKDVGIYYKSVWGTFEHILGGDLALFGNVFRMYCASPEKHNDKVFSYGDFAGLRPEAGKNIEEVLVTRAKVDELIIEMVADMKDLEKVETLEFPGIKFEKPRYQLVMAILTHATHHRGQIAAALDILGIDNDFSSLLGV